MRNTVRLTLVVAILALAAMLVLTACSVQMHPAAVVPTLESHATTEAAAVVPLPTPEIVPTETRLIPVDALMNASYSGIYDEPVILGDGKFENMFEGQLFTVEYINGSELFADLDEDGVKDAIVFLIEKGGGTARFTYVAVQLNRNGQPLDAGAAMVEDRTQVRSTSVEDGQVVLDITTRGPGDGDCCPSYKSRKIYTLEAGRLVEVLSEQQELVKISADDLNGTSWTLVELDAGNPVLVDSEVTIRFNGDQISGSGGCNSYTSSFSLGDPNPFIITNGPIAATKKACPDPLLSQENAYFTALEESSLWGYMYGKLVLAYPGGRDGGLNRMLFTPQEMP